MIYIDRVETKWPLRIQLPIGTNVPFYCTASGKMYLSMLKKAHLDRYLGSVKFEQLTPSTIMDKTTIHLEIRKTREQGFAQDNEEFMEGMVALAVPVTDPSGRYVASLAFHGPSQRLTLDKAISQKDVLLDGANRLQNILFN